ncbi:hybrid sensor histidine kinase/response regulator [Ralstonia pickettii]|nr:hybrid sensor histidine kinase/response regulator [Ralstonia pickettii]
MPNLQLLLVEDNPLDAELTRARLEAANLPADTVLVDNETDFIAQLSARTFDAILADYMLPQFTGAEALDIARRMAPQTPFIFVSGALGEEHAVDMLKRGATDYVIKQRLQRLPVVLLRALAEAAERRQRIAAEAALRETETHFRLLINALKEHAVLSLDPQGIVRTWNAASHSILGYAREDILGKSAEILYPQAAREAGDFQRKLERVRREGSLTDDRWMLRKDGTPFYASSVVTAIHNENGQLIGFSKIIRDATEERVAADTLRRAKEEAETANHAKDHFLAVLSHELRTPLTPILTAVHLLELRQDLPQYVVAQLEVIRRNAELEARLIDDLLDITGISRGKLAVSFAPVDLYTLLESTLDMSRNDMQSKRLSLKTRFEASRSRLFADGARIQQVIWNLVRNAVKFTPEGGAIEVRVWNPGPTTIAVAVKDNGIGIEPEALPRIFSAFEQADASITQRFGGLGLGLAIAHALVQKHEGSLTAESAGRHQGATFTLTLPLAAATAEPETPPAPPMPRPQPTRGLHVLLVEDNVDTAEAMSQMLEILGHTVTVANGARTAMQAAESGTFDLLISDIGLPDGSGLDVVRVFAERQAAPSIAITGYGMEDDIARCREAGFTDHLTKPVDFKRLEALLAGYLAARDARTAGAHAG